MGVYPNKWNPDGVGSGPHEAHHHLHNRGAPECGGGGGGEVPLENQTEGVAVGHVEHREGGDGRVDVHRVQPGPENALCQPPAVKFFDRLDGRDVECLYGFALGQVLATVHVFGHHHPDVGLVARVVVEGELDQAAQGGFGDEVVEVELAFGLPHAAVGLFQNGQVEAFLVLEVVVNHPFAGVGGGRDLVDAGTSQPFFREFAHGHLQDVGHGPLGVVGALSPCMYRFVHFVEYRGGGARPQGVSPPRG